MRLRGTRSLWLGLMSAVGLASAAQAQSWPGDGRSFQRIATLPNYFNNADIADQTVSEIVAATKNGKTLVYTDSPGGQIGFVDLTDPFNPVSGGTFRVAGEPTSVAVLGNTLALVAVNTSESFTEPSGHLAVVNIQTRKVVATIPLDGQPDSLKISADGKFAAVVIENERDEEIEVGGEEGGLPQLPGGFLAIVDLKGHPTQWTVRTADLSGLAGYAPEDPEAEFVDINDRNEAVVTLQENNHIAIVDLRTGNVVDHFDAGTVDLSGVDATEDGVIELVESLSGVPREPDAVTWIADDLIATANEGDLFGGSRGFSIFDRSGTVLFDSGNALETIAVRHGHYPEDRSENKGTEPESIEYARFGDQDYLFVGSERGSFVAVYELGGGATVKFLQLLPAPLGPEGLLAIPERGLLIASGEEDDPSFGVRSTLMVYKLLPGRPTYPQILSGNDAAGLPIPWSALSGMTALPGRSDTLLAVWDSYYSESRIFTLDVSAHPAMVTAQWTIVGGSGNYDPEGITVAPDGSYWIASEGNAGSRRNRLLQTDSLGNVLAEIGLPAEIEACRAASTNRGTLGSGFEGVAALPTGSGYVLLVAQQRGWDYTTPECEALDDDPAGVNAAEPAQTRIWIYDPASGVWDHAAYELEALPPNTSWVGLSEVTRVGSSFIVIERDNRSGDFGQLKTLVKFTASAAVDGVISAAEKSVYDLIPALEATNGWITDKPEGVAVTPDGRVYVVTDNDGVEDWSGETWFLPLGGVSRLFQ